MGKEITATDCNVPVSDAGQSTASVHSSVQDYLREHGVSAALNDALKSIVANEPQDVYGELAHFLAARALPASVHSVRARQVLDSRGEPTVQVDVLVEQFNTVSVAAREACPSGASKGGKEAVELRDVDSDAFGGRGVLSAVSVVNDTLAAKLKGVDPIDLKAVDKILIDTDGSKRKSKLGGNVTTAVSFAFAAAGAAVQRIELFEHFSRIFDAKLAESGYDAKASLAQREPLDILQNLPRPMMNVLNGGKHAGGDLRFQEFMIVPRRDTMKTMVQICVEVYHSLKRVITKEKGAAATGLGDEGGFAPDCDDAEDALQMIEKAIHDSRWNLGTDVFLALDVAANEFYDAKQRAYELSAGKHLSAAEMVEMYVQLVKSHPALISIEDPFNEDDHDSWIALREALADDFPQVRIVGDDLFASNIDLVGEGIEAKWAHSLLLKVNQVGTITEAMDAAILMKYGQEIPGDFIVSHRSGETTSSVIADLAVGTGADFIKTGAPARGERVAKYNRLLAIEQRLQSLVEPTAGDDQDADRGAEAASPPKSSPRTKKK